MAVVRKLIVEVAEATNLSPKDGQGASSPYVVANFHGQRRRTRTVVKDLCPRWSEVLEFAVKSSDVFGNALEIDVLHDKAYGPTTRNNSLGRVRLSSSQFVWKGEEALIYYPLRSKSWFSWVQGDIGLKIYYTVEVPPPPPPPTQPAAEEAKPLEADAAPPPPLQESAEQLPAPPDGAAAAGSTTPATPPADGAKPDEEPPNEDAPAPAPPSTENAPPDGETTVEAESTETVDATSEDSQVPPPTPAPSRTSMGPEMNAASHWVPPPPLPPELMAASVSASVPQVRFAGLNGPHPPMPPMTRTYTMDSLDSVVMERSSFDLVEKMHYLFIRVVKARHLPTNGGPVVKIVVSGTHVKSKPARKSASTAFFEWDQTFAFGRDAPESSSILEVSVWDPPPAHMDRRTSSDVAGHKFFGGICFDASEIPLRDPPDSPLAPQWYRLEGGGAHHGDLMLATWIGTQADESFPDAWKTDAAGDVNARAKVYQSPKLWYLRATVLEAQDVLPLTAAAALRETSFQIKAQLGFQMQKTKVSIARDGAPSWNEDLLFVVAEPFSDNLKLTIETRLPGGPVVIGEATVPLMAIERRVDDRKVASRWFTLEDFSREKAAYKGRVHLRLCFDGGYHVMDEAAHVCSDYRPTARQLWKPPIGSVELGIIGCKSLLPMKTVNGKGSTDAYCVAKYGPKWVRTRTVLDTLDPRWNEQYTWRVYDPCTVLTIGVFDSWGSSESDGPQEATPPDYRIGKVRIRISTLQANRVYRNSYPLLLLSNAGVKKMGEVEIAVRFGRTAPTLDVLHVYSQPLLPLMHHVKPLGIVQQELLRSAAVKIVAAHLSRSEPPLKREAVLYMLDADSHTFSMRKVRANWLRIVGVLAGLIDAVRWIEDTRGWKNPTATALVHALLIMLVWFPDLIVPTLAFYVFTIGAWNYRFRARGPVPHFDPKMSLADAADREELDEEFDQPPCARPPEVVRARYDKLRAIGARAQTVLGDLAAQGERVQALVTWRDPRATGIFIMMCFVVAVILYSVPTQMVAMASGFYYFRHPIFRDRMPSPALNFFRRLPSLADRMM